MTRKDWRNFVTGVSTRGVDAAKTSAVVRGWIEAYLREAEETIALLLSPEQETKLNTLLARWNQIQRLCGKATDVIAATATAATA
jgi:hypothetical protein